MSDRPTRVVIAGGGTGGHVTMALALGEELARRGDAVLFIGAQRGLEARLVPEAGFELRTLPAQPVAGRSGWKRIGALLSLARATVGALGALRSFDAQVVISVGGYAAAPAAAAAVLRRTPLVLVEPNAVAGRTNRAVGRFAQRVFTAFRSAAPPFERRLGPARVRTEGAPLRRALLDAFRNAPERRMPVPPFRLLVAGGSQGARQLNEAMIEALPRLDASRIEIFHQSGQDDRKRVEEAYALAGFRAQVVDFEPDLAARYCWADLGLCRAGALTVAELALAGLPALLVPYPFAADDHQRANARELEQAGAARLLDPDGFGGAVLADAVIELFERPERLLAMSRAAAGAAHPRAAERIVDSCRALAHQEAS